MRQSQEPEDGNETTAGDLEQVNETGKAGDCVSETPTDGRVEISIWSPCTGASPPVLRPDFPLHS